MIYKDMLLTTLLNEPELNYFAHSYMVSNIAM